MAEKPIIFSGEMVRAILDGRKTQTRRVIKPQPPVNCDACRPLLDTKGELLSFRFEYSFDPDSRGYKDPVYFPGDLLRVREAIDAREVIAKYRADSTPLQGGHAKLKPKCYSSRFMPKWAARLWLKVLKVRAERVQEISTIEAMREGVLPEPDARVETKICVMGKQPREIFGLVWDSLNAKPKPAKKNPYTAEPELCQVAYPWEDVREITTINRKASKWYGLKVYVCGNPAIFVYEFERTNHG